MGLYGPGLIPETLKHINKSRVKELTLLSSLKKVFLCIYNLLGIIQVDSRKRRVLDELLVTWTLSFGGGCSSFFLISSGRSSVGAFCASAIASQSTLTQLQI